MAKRVLVTGGAGFIGSAVVRHLVATGATVLNFDKLTYAGNLASVGPVADHPNYHSCRPTSAMPRRCAVRWKASSRTR